MTSGNDKSVARDDDNPKVVYGNEAVQLVVKGYNGLNQKMHVDQNRGIFPRGAFLVEFIHKTTWEPILLSSDKYLRFLELTKLKEPHDVLWAIWNILEVSCNERRLKPTLALERAHAQLVVMLYK